MENVTQSMPKADRRLDCEGKINKVKSRKQKVKNELIGVHLKRDFKQ